jgi:hypothetical protein
VWPTPAQQHLLRAALDRTPRALFEFASWRALVDAESMLGRAALRLLPLAYENLRAHGSTDPLLARMKGVYRRAWAETHHLFHGVKPAIERLHRAGVDVTLIKGAPLALAYYRNLAVRPMSDVDLLVPVEQAREAAQALIADGWRPPAWVNVTHAITHAMQFVHWDGATIDLHRFATRSRMTVSANAWFARDRLPLDFLGLEVRRMTPTRELTLTIQHGVRWNIETPVRWIADAVVLLREHHEAIDWDDIGRFAREHALAPRLLAGLSHLRDVYDAPIPLEVVDAIGRRKPGLIERIDRAISPVDGSRPPRRDIVAVYLSVWGRLIDPTQRFAGPRAAWRAAAAIMAALRAKDGGLLQAIMRRARKRIQRRAAAAALDSQ